MENKRILTMQDLSCVGQCSLTVALPILSAHGIEACILPTAILSNHTMFKTWSFFDLTDEISNIFNQWKENQFQFDAFLLGYLGRKEHTAIAEACFQEFANEDAKIIIDPVFGDNGKLYGGFDLEYVAAIRGLLKHADVILPNVTEASYLAEVAYKEDYDTSYVLKIARKLKKYTSGKIIITGVEIGNKIGELIFNDGRSRFLWHELIPAKRHGTGDIFASVFTSYYLSNHTISQSSNAAAKFVAECLKNTEEEHFYGVHFEKVIRSKLKNRVLK